MFFLFLLIFIHQLAPSDGMHRELGPMRTGRHVLANADHLKKFSLVDLSILIRKLEGIEEGHLAQERAFREIFDGSELDDDGISAQILAEASEKVYKIIRTLENNVLDRIEMSNQIAHFGSAEIDAKFLKRRAHELVDLMEPTSVMEFMQKMDIGQEAGDLGKIRHGLDAIVDKLDSHKKRILLEHCVRLTGREKNGYIYAHLLALARLLIRQFLSGQIGDTDQSVVGYMNLAMERSGFFPIHRMKIAVVDYVRAYDQFEVQWNRRIYQLHRLIMFQGNVPSSDGTAIPIEDGHRAGTKRLNTLEVTEERLGEMAHFYIDSRREIVWLNSQIWFLRPSEEHDWAADGEELVISEGEQLLLRDCFHKWHQNFYQFYHCPELAQFNYLRWKLLDAVIEGDLMEEMSIVPLVYNYGQNNFIEIDGEGEGKVQVPPQPRHHTMAKIWHFIRNRGPNHIEDQQHQTFILANLSDFSDPFWANREHFDQEELSLVIRLLESIDLTQLAGEKPLVNILMESGRNRGWIGAVGEEKWTNIIGKMNRIIEEINNKILNKIEQSKYANFGAQLRSENPEQIDVKFILKRAKELEHIFGPEQFHHILTHQLAIFSAGEKNDIEKFMRDPRRSGERKRKLLEFCLKLTNTEKNRFAYAHLLAMARILVQELMTHFHHMDGGYFVPILDEINAKLVGNERISIVQIMAAYDRMEVSWNVLAKEKAELATMFKRKMPMSEAANLQAEEEESQQILKQLKLAERQMALMVGFHANLNLVPLSGSMAKIWHLYTPSTIFTFERGEQLILRKCVHKYLNLYELFYSEEMRREPALRSKLELLVIEANLIEEMRRHNSGEYDGKLVKMREIHYGNGLKMAIPPQAHRQIVQNIRDSIRGSFAPSRHQGNIEGGDGEEDEAMAVHCQVRVE